MVAALKCSVFVRVQYILVYGELVAQPCIDSNYLSSIPTCLAQLSTVSPKDCALLARDQSVQALLWAQYHTDRYRLQSGRVTEYRY